MAATKATRPTASAKRHDPKIWCETCQGGDFKKKGDLYLCASCGKLLMGHSVHHEGFPHVVGDEGSLY